MSYKNDFDIFIGGSSGVFKGIKLGGKRCIMKNIRSLVSIKNHEEVTTLSWGDADEREVLIGCGVKDSRSIKVYDTECNTFTSSFLCDCGEGSIRGIARYDDALLTAVSSGEIKLWRYNENDEFVINAGPNIQRMRQSCVNKNIIAVGGQENRLRLFDLETRSQIFQEKNLPHDSLGLRIPICISDLNFFSSSNQVVTVGRYGHVRLYDPTKQRRPVISLVVKDAALTSLAITKRELQVIVGSGTGKMNLVDLRNPAKVLNSYKGAVGSITGIACCSSQPFVVSASMDKYIRIHNIHTKELLEKVYVTTKILSLLLRSEFVLNTKHETVECQD